MPIIDFESVVPRLDAILSRGLCGGVGQRDGQMCIEAAICAALGLPHGDEPTCVHPAVRDYKIRLNDAPWSSAAARASGLRRLGILQIGTDTGFDASRFVTELSIRTVRDLLSDLLERVRPARYATHIAACRSAQTREEAQAAAGDAASYASYASSASYAAYAAFYASYAASAASYTSYAASYASYASYAASSSASYAASYVSSYVSDTRLADLPADHYLLMSARIAESILVAMQTPGAQWLASVEKE